MNNTTNNYISKYLPITMWSICTVFYAYQYLLQVSPSVMTNNLMQSFQVNATMLGNLAACYFYAYAGMQIPVGIICDRFGVRRPLIIASALCAIGSIMFGCSNIFAIATMGRLLIGLGGAFAAVGTFCIANLWLPIRLFALFAGGIVTIGMLGAAGGQLPLALLVNALDWRNTMMLLGGVGLIITVLMFFILRDPVQKFPDILQKQRMPLFNGLKQIIRNQQIWLLAIYGGLMFMPVSVIGSLWGTPFLMHKYSISNAEAGSMIIMLFFGLAIGSPFFGWFSDRINRRKIVMLVGNLGALLCMLGIIYPQFPEYFTVVLLFLYGFFCGGFLVCFAAAREIDASKNTGVNMGFMNMLNMIGGAVIQPVVGYILDAQWQGIMENGVRIYVINDFQIAFTIIPICLVFALLILPSIKETHCRAITATE